MKQPKTMISLEQAALLLGVPQWILRRFVGTPKGKKSLGVISTTGSHLRVSLNPIIDDPEKIVSAISEWRTRVSLRGDSRGLTLDPVAQRKAESLRQVIRETYDADTAGIKLGVSRPTLRRWEREGKLVGTRPIGPKQVRYYRESVDALLAGSAL